MNFFNSLDISASALTAQRFRMDVIAQNIANQETTRTAEGTPYRRRNVVLEQRTNTASFSSVFEDARQKVMGAGVRVASVEEDPSPFKLKYDPTHPDANEEGYVELPNVDTITEMVDMISASNAYDANVTAISVFKNMAMKALEIGR